MLRRPRTRRGGPEAQPSRYVRVELENGCALVSATRPLLYGRAAAVASPAANRRIRSARLYRGSASRRVAPRRGEPRRSETGALVRSLA